MKQYVLVKPTSPQGSEVIQTKQMAQHWYNFLPHCPGTFSARAQ